MLFPTLDINEIAITRDALHAYSRVLGAWCKTCHPRRKHWWHASLKPSVSGLATGVIYSGIDIELELNLSESLLVARNSNGDKRIERLTGQSTRSLASVIQDFMLASGTDEENIPELSGDINGTFAGYSSELANQCGQTISAVSRALDQFRGSIYEETSPIQLWPHHFDLSMLWLPGEKIPGQDPVNEEYSDKQMNFGFTFGDTTISVPYFYVTAYPLPEALSELPLPAGAHWHSEGFQGAVVPYRELMRQTDPNEYLVDLWSFLLASCRKQMMDVENTINLDRI